ncbi:MAG: hypothetical protein K5894_05680 [Lachnospiraceae bacterium]|nr:hypothetical protein [Lachnospiraceae bacterium]
MKKTKGRFFFSLIIVILIIIAVGGMTYSVFKSYLEKKGSSLMMGHSDHATVSDERSEPLLDESEIDEEIKEQLDKATEESTIEESKETVSVDLIVFAGQSNMSGLGGDATRAVTVKEGAGAEFRAVSDPTKLYTITEPFGFYENTETMNDLFLKRGSLVSAFVNAYYEETGVPVIAVSASKGGTPSTYWATDIVGEDVVTRFINAKTWLKENGYTVRNQFLVFLQGENDVLENVSTSQYLTDLNTFSSKMFYRGIDKFLMIRIGRTKEDPDAFKRIIDVQTELCRTDPRFVLISTMLSAFGEEYMVDSYHYNQDALNALGTDAGINAAKFAETRVDPQLIDYRTGETYIPDDRVLE